MSLFDFDRFNGFMRHGLDDLLFSDLWEHYIFNESDLHSAAYFYIREYFNKNERPNIYVRCEPQLARMKPDIVIFDKAEPIYAIEFKFFTKPDSINEEALFRDLDKLAKIVGRFDSMKWGFFYMVHDGEEPYTLSNPSLRRRGYERISVSTINLRRREDTGRRRNNYDCWRMEFDALLSLHRKHA
ncbi:MAG: hypothetical protein HY284_06085 [Nitrospirae bacterium]|nr:hypothetical protein [Nitrospirota bacterium]